MEPQTTVVSSDQQSAMQESAAALQANPPASGSKNNSQKPKTAPATQPGTTTASEPGARQEYTGTVVGHQAKFGFIRSQATDSRLFFHVNNADGNTTQGATVSFLLSKDPNTGKDIAIDVRTISRPEPTSSHAANAQGKPREEHIPGVFTGVVSVAPRGPPSVRIDDGMISFNDEDGVQRQALFGTWRLLPSNATNHPGSNAGGKKHHHHANNSLQPAIHLHPGDIVDFEVVRNSATKAWKAVNIRPANNSGKALGNNDTTALRKIPSGGGFPPGISGGSNVGGGNRPTLTLASEEGQQLGRVTLLKKEFGFIKQVARPGDVFFHFSQLEGIDPADIKINDDVEYSLRRDHNNGKLSALQVRRAAPGSVVFDVVSETVLQGIILERPATTKHHLATCGVLQYTPPKLVTTTPATSTAAAVSSSTTTTTPQEEESGGASSSLLTVQHVDPAVSIATGSSKNGAPLKIPFYGADIVGGAQSAIRPGDNVSFRIATNLAAARAAASATVPGAAALAGRRAVEVTLLKLNGLVRTVHKERQFGFITYNLPAILDGSGSSQKVGEGSSSSSGGEEKGEEEQKVADSVVVSEKQAQEEIQGAEKATPPTSTDAAAVETTASSKEEEATATEAPPTTCPVEEDASVAAAASKDTSTAEGQPAAATTTTAVVVAKPKQSTGRHKVFFHFNEVSGGVLLKPGDEVVFVLHTNLKSGETNAQRVKRIKEGPALPPSSSSGGNKNEKNSGLNNNAVAKEVVPATNPNKLKLTGNLQSGEHRSVKMPKGPDGSKGFEQTSERASTLLEETDPESAVHALIQLAISGPLGLSKSSSGFLSVDAKPFVPI